MESGPSSFARVVQASQPLNAWNHGRKWELKLAPGLAGNSLCSIPQDHPGICAWYPVPGKTIGAHLAGRDLLPSNPCPRIKASTWVSVATSFRWRQMCSVSWGPLGRPEEQLGQGPPGRRALQHNVCQQLPSALGWRSENVIAFTARKGGKRGKKKKRHYWLTVVLMLPQSDIKAGDGEALPSVGHHSRAWLKK